jgi:hypothetical protein
VPMHTRILVKMNSTMMKPFARWQNFSSINQCFAFLGERQCILLSLLHRTQPQMQDR